MFLKKFLENFKIHWLKIKYQFLQKNYNYHTNVSYYKYYKLLHVCNSNCYYFSSLGHYKDIQCLGNKFLEPFAQIAHIFYKDIQLFEITKQLVSHKI